MFSVLRIRNFFLLWVGQIISMIGDWVYILALPFYIFDLTKSATATGGMFIAIALPRLLFGSLAGVFVDRWDRRWTMIIADVARALVILVLLVVRSAEWIWVIYVVAMLEATISQFFIPAKSAIIPSLVPEKQLVAANSLDAFSDAINRLIGPSLGGALYGFFGIVSIILIESGSFLVSAIFILMIVVPRNLGLQGARESAKEQQKAPSTTGNPLVQVWNPLLQVWKELVAGLQLVARNRLLVLLFVGGAITMVAEGIIEVLLVAYTSEVLHGTAATLGWVMTAQGLGGLIGSFFIERVSKRIPLKYLMISAFVVIGVTIIIMVNIPILLVNIVLIAIAGLFMVGLMIGIQTLMQTNVADEYRGRVFGSYGTLVTITMLIGMGFASALSSILGTVALMSIAGGFFIIGGLVYMGLPNTTMEEVTVLSVTDKAVSVSGDL